MNLYPGKDPGPQGRAALRAWHRRPRPRGVDLILKGIFGACAALLLLTTVTTLVFTPFWDPALPFLLIRVFWIALLVTIQVREPRAALRILLGGLLLCVLIDKAGDRLAPIVGAFGEALLPFNDLLPFQIARTGSLGSWLLLAATGLALARPVPPDRPRSPRRARVVLGAELAVLVLCVGGAWGLKAHRDHRTPARVLEPKARAAVQMAVDPQVPPAKPR